MGIGVVTEKVYPHDVKGVAQLQVRRVGGVMAVHDFATEKQKKRETVYRDVQQAISRFIILYGKPGPADWIGLLFMREDVGGYEGKYQAST